MIRDDTWRRVRDLEQPAECRRVGFGRDAL